MIVVFIKYVTNILSFVTISYIQVDSAYKLKLSSELTKSNGHTSYSE